MKTLCVVLAFFLPWGVFAQYKMHTQSLAPVQITTKTAGLNYPLWVDDVRALGMGGAQTAMGRDFMGNPAVLAQKSYGVYGFKLNMGIPTPTLDAALFLENNMDEFMEAASMTRIWDAVNAFFATGASANDRWAALQEIQDGMAFTLDLVSEVTGPAAAPRFHGFSVLPAVTAQIGHWGVSFYGYGQGGFMVRMSPTLEALAAVEIPENLDNPLQATRSLLQMMAILGVGLVQDANTFSREIMPVAFYLSTMDVVGSVGYGRSVTHRLDVGASMKIVNRRFMLDRIPVVDFDVILENAFSDFSRDITGVTFDLGAHYTLPFKTEVGLALQNILPLQTIDDGLSMDFIHHQMAYQRDNAGQIVVDADGDTALVRYKIPVELRMPFKLETPLVASIGVHHPLTPDWHVALDWVDLLENDIRFESTLARIRAGMEYGFAVSQDKMNAFARVGMSDERFTWGLGVNFFDMVFFDYARAYDRFIQDFSNYFQIRIGF